MKNHDEANVLHCGKTKLCRTLHGFWYVHNKNIWGCWFCMKPDCPTFSQRRFPALILLDREAHLSIASLLSCLTGSLLKYSFSLSQLFLWNIPVKYVLLMCCFWETNILWLCILPLFKTRCIVPLKLPGGGYWGVPKRGVWLAYVSFTCLFKKVIHIIWPLGTLTVGLFFKKITAYVHVGCHSMW